MTSPPSPPITAGRDLARARPGERVCIHADLTTLGLPLTTVQTVVLANVNFVPPEGSRPASVVGALVRAGRQGLRDGVLLREGSGALAVRLGTGWRLGWRAAGYHPGKRGWYALDEAGLLVPLHRVDVAVGAGRHLFVRIPGEREYPRGR